jgi:hypothetical protein
MLEEGLYIFVVVYLDNVLIYTKGTLKDHIEKVKWVLQQYEKCDMLFNLKKYKFFTKEVEFMGHVVTTEGIKMQQDKIHTILDWLKPKTVKEVQSFLGKCGYY